ncbi:MAG TPA: hypothetical protein VL053_00245, partial [Arachidicoccus sp.]|nr:hypothetical protein [Arachidicoccus sp.]
MRLSPKYILITFLIASISLSCNKLFDLKPEDGIVRDDFWKTKEQVHAAVVGVYASLMGDP